jgi:predicted nucleic acid-binding protein
MSDKVFIDTNLWVYIFVQDPAEKAEKVTTFINAQTASLIISAQVLGELYNVLIRKSTFSQPDAQAIILGLVDNKLRIVNPFA